MFTKFSASVTYYVMHMAKHHKTRYEQSDPIELISLKPPKLLRPWWNYLTPQIMPLSSEYICHNTQNMGDRRLRGTMYGSDEVYASEVLPSGITLAAYLVRTIDIQKQTIAKHKICKEETSENTTSEDRTTIALDQSDRSR